jgi:hypothetical protein
VSGARAIVAASEEPLKLLISVEQTQITAPFPARATLHFHNASKQALWLYRRVRSQAKEGSTVEARLDALDARQEIVAPAHGRALESAGLPRPKLVRLESEGDTTEKVTLKVFPTRVGTEGEGTPVWGQYRLSLVYRARFSNAAEIGRETGALLWQGDAISNSIEIELKPPAGEGSVAGSVLNAQGQPLSDVIVSLSDQDERLADQTLTDSEGCFSFTPLPLGQWWVTVRRPDFTEDTAAFRSVRLTAAEPSGSIEFVLYPPDIYEPRGILHKPVILLVTDGLDNPLEKVSYESVWSSGKVLDAVKGEVGRNGLATFEVIPGRNFVTLKRSGCAKAEHRMDVSPGEGAEGFKLALDCSRK